jgi:hypothetical protein
MIAERGKPRVSMRFVSNTAGAIGVFEANDTEAERGEDAALGWGEGTLKRIRGHKPEARCGPTAAYKGLNSRKGRGCWATHKIGARVVMQVMEETIAGKAAIKEAEAVGG